MQSNSEEEQEILKGTASPATYQNMQKVRDIGFKTAVSPRKFITTQPKRNNRVTTKTIISPKDCG